MIWNKKKDGAENPGAETPAAQTTKAPVLFLQKNWKWLVPVVCVVIAGGVFLLKPKSASTTAVDPSYLEASPEVRDVSNTLSGTGTLNPANTYTVKSLVEGKVLTGEFEEGDVLDEGTVLWTARTLPPILKRPRSPCSRRSAAMTRWWTASMCVPKWMAP